MEAGLNETAAGHIETLAGNLAAIPAVAAAVFDGPASAAPATSAVPLALPAPSLASPAIPSFRWTPRLSTVEAYCPLSIVRGRLRRCLQSQLAGLAATVRERVVEALDGCVIQAVDRLSAEAATRAAEAENRFLNAASGLTMSAQELRDTTRDAIGETREQLAGIFRRLGALRDVLAEKCLGDEAWAEVVESAALSPVSAELEGVGWNSAGRQGLPADGLARLAVPGLQRTPAGRF